MKNPFEQHGITHLSPSALNLFIASPGIWAYRYIARHKDAGNVKMWRGNAVEKGYVAFLRSFEVEASYDVAKQAFDEEVSAHGTLDDAAEKEAQLIEPMLDQCLLWTPPSDLRAAQIKVEHWFGSIPVPVIGYVDLAFEGSDVDLKTTMRIPSKPDPAHVRQVSLYRAARLKPGAILYVSDKRHAYYEITNAMMQQGLTDLEEAAKKAFKLLGTFSNVDEMLAALPIDWDSYLAPKARFIGRAPASEDFDVVNG